MSRVRGARFAILPEWLLYDLEVSDRAIRLYAVLARHADSDGRSCPSRQRLASLLGCSVDTVDRAKQELIAAQALVVQQRRDAKGDLTSNDYLLLADEPGGRTDAATPPQECGDGGRTDAATGGRTDAAMNESLSEREPLNERTTAPASPAPEATVTEIRPRDLVWDAVMAACAIDSTSITKSARGAYNRAVGDLRSIEASPEEIHLRAQRHLALWPHVSLTPNSLARHWAELSEDPRRVPAMSHATNAAQQWLAMGDGR